MSAAGTPEFQNRTLVCSVLIIGIVEYSCKSPADQARLKARCNTLLLEALRGIAVNDRIVLDTSDGVAASFIGDPEDALFVATSLRDLLETGAHTPNDRSFARMAINLGPVRLVKDINGQPNIVGEGINVAQRLMTIAKPGQVLVSQSFYQVVSRLSQASSRVFSYEVAGTDNTAREHEVYAIGATVRLRTRADAVLSGQLQDGAARRGRNGALAGIGRVFGRPTVASLIAVVVIIGTAVFARDYRETHEPHRQSAAQAPVATLSPEPCARRVSTRTSGELRSPWIAGHLS
jgi:hypothetical protein